MKKYNYYNDLEYWNDLNLLYQLFYLKNIYSNKGQSNKKYLFFKYLAL